MAKKRSMSKAKRPMMDSKMNMNSGRGMHHCCRHYWHWMWAKLSVVAFVLFLITVWPWLNMVAMSVRWFWYLVAAIIFCVLHWSMHSRYHRMHGM